MTIPATPFNDCDCCGYGFTMFENREDPNWYLGSTIHSPSNALQIINKSTGNRQTPTDFALASHLHAIDDQGFFYYLVQTSSNSISSPKIYKIDSSGNTIWEYTPAYNSGRHTLGGLVLDASRNVYIAYSRINSVTGTGSDEAVVEKINSSGSLVWSAVYSTANFPPTYDYNQYHPADIAISNSGRIHVTGEQRIVDTALLLNIRRSYFEWQLDTDGNEIWVHHDTEPLNGATGLLDVPFGDKCVFNSSGDVICSYRGTAEGGGTDYSLVSYDAAGGIVFSYEQGTLGGSPFKVPELFDIEMLNDRLYYLRIASAELFCGRLSGSDLQTSDWEESIDTGVSAVPDPASWPIVRVDKTGNAYISYRKSSPAAQFYAKASSSGTLVYQDTTNAAALAHVPMIPPGRPPIFI